MNLWNANCDSRIPKPKRELLRELEIWERAQGGRAPVPAGSNVSNSVMRKDFDGAAWSVTHEDNFKKLIENARMKNGPNIPAPKPESPSVSDETPTALSPNPVDPVNHVEAEESLSSPLPESSKDDHDIQHNIVDLTSKEVEGIGTRSDGGLETEGPAVTLENNAEMEPV